MTMKKDRLGDLDRLNRELEKARLEEKHAIKVWATVTATSARYTQQELQITRDRVDRTAQVATRLQDELNSLIRDELTDSALGR